MSGSVGKRERKKPDLYNPSDFEPDSGDGRKAARDNSTSKKARGHERGFQDVAEEPATLLERRISVQYKSHSQAQWYDGVIKEHFPGSSSEPFLIKFDDGEEEKGRIGQQGTFRPSKQNTDRPYKWLVDTERARVAPTATEHSSQELAIEETDNMDERGAVEIRLEQAPVVKRGRGRPRKQPAQAMSPTKQSMTKPDIKEPSSAEKPDLNGTTTRLSEDGAKTAPVDKARSNNLEDVKDAAQSPPVEDQDGSEKLILGKLPSSSQEKQKFAPHETVEAKELSGTADPDSSKEAVTKEDFGANTAVLKKERKPDLPPGGTDTSAAALSQSAAHEIKQSSPILDLPSMSGAEKDAKGAESPSIGPPADIQANGLTDQEMGVRPETAAVQSGTEQGPIAASGSPKANGKQQPLESSTLQHAGKSKLAMVKGSQHEEQPSHSPAAVNAALAGKMSPQEGLKRKPSKESMNEAAKRLKLDLSGAAKPSKVTSIAAPTSLKILQQAPLQPDTRKSPAESSPEEAQYEPEAAPGPTPAEVEAEVVCSQLGSQLSVLTRTRDSIGRATACALSGAACQAAPRVIRLIADAMEKEAASARRIDMLYLVDSILQGCVRPGKPGCGPGSPAAATFPKVVAAALPRLVKAVTVSAEGSEKLSKISVLQASMAAQAKSEAAASQPLATGLPASQRGSKGASTVKLMLNTGSESVSADLEDQYGTHKQLGNDLLLPRREESSDSDSDDEPDEHERELRAKQGLQSVSMAPLPMNMSAFAGDGEVHLSRDPDHSWHAKSGGPPGFEMFSQPSGGLNIQLHNRSNSRGSMQELYTPQNRSRPPSTPQNRSRPPSVGLQRPNMAGYSQDEDRFDWAGPADRGFVADEDRFHRQSMSVSGGRYGVQRFPDDVPHIPPIRVDDSWNEGIPPLPEDAPPLPAEEDDEGPPPLPDDPPPLPPDDEPFYHEAAQYPWSRPSFQVSAPRGPLPPMQGRGGVWHPPRGPF